MHIKEYISASHSLLSEGVSPDAVFKALKSVLKSNHHLSLYPKVLRGLLASRKRYEKQNALQVTLARESDAHVYKKQIEAVAQSLGGDMEPIYIIDPTVIGGYRVESKGRSIDSTYKTQLRTLYTSLTKTL